LLNVKLVVNVVTIGRLEG